MHCVIYPYTNRSGSELRSRLITLINVNRFFTRILIHYCSHSRVDQKFVQYKFISQMISICSRFLRDRRVSVKFKTEYETIFTENVIDNCIFVYCKDTNTNNTSILRFGRAGN